jgi:hypothetical protein
MKHCVLYCYATICCCGNVLTTPLLISGHLFLSHCSAFSHHVTVVTHPHLETFSSALTITGRFLPHWSKALLTTVNTDTGVKCVIVILGVTAQTLLFPELWELIEHRVVEREETKFWVKWIRNKREVIKGSRREAGTESREITKRKHASHYQVGSWGDSHWQKHKKTL